MQRDKRQDVHAGTISRAFFTEEASCDGMARVEKQKAESRKQKAESRKQKAESRRIGLDWHETKNKGGVTPSFGTLDNSLASEDINSPN